jgi:polyisoprenoid-binding protein YceI
MKSTAKRTALVASLCLALFTTAHAAEYGTLVPAQSQVIFTSKQMNVPVDGKFGKFSAVLNFDPAKPAAAKAQIDIDLTSIDAGSAEANSEVAGKGWFDVKTYPTARFVSSSVASLGGGRYEAHGQLSLKGKTRDATIGFTFSTSGNNGVFDGTLTLMRTQFGIGDGAWGDTSVVADAVPIKFHLVASPKK